MDPRMSNHDTATAAPSPDDVDSALDDLALDEEIDASEVSAISDLEDDVNEEADADAVDSIEDASEAAEIAKLDAYDEQTSATVEPDALAKAKENKATSSAESKAKSRSKPRDVTSLPDDVFDLSPDSTLKKADVLALRPTQKKIGEKFDNLFTSIAAGKPPSVYIMTCFKALVDGGTVTQSDLVKVLRGSYSEGTARSQAGQIMTLFNTLKIATRSGQTLTLSPDSTIANKLKTLLPIPAAV